MNNENNYQLTVVVPIYGVEKYIERCARSLFKQTQTNIEYIFVNDCTKDKSLDVLQRVINDYPHLKEHIKVIHHQRNKGLPQARKTGIEASTGLYIVHCDSDDWVDPTAYEKMLKTAIRNEADMVVCAYYKSTGSEHVPFVFKGELTLRELFFNYAIFSGMWCKMIKRDVYFDTSIIYPQANMFEDRAFTVQLAYKCKKIEYIDEPLYYYFNNNSSICLADGEQNCINRWMQAKENTELIINFFIKENLLELYSEDIDKLKFSVKHQLSPLVHKTLYFKKWKDTYSEINRKIIFTNILTLSSKIKYVLTLLRIFPILRRLYHYIKY